MDRMDRIAQAMERQADAFERLAASLEKLAERLAQPEAKPKRPRVEPIAPEEIEAEAAKLEGPAREVWEILDRLARVNAGRTRKHVRPVKPAAVLAAIRDHQDRDHVAVARDYAAWQEHSARTPHTDVVAGYRNQLKMAPAVVRPAVPRGQRPGMDRLLSDEALEEAMR